MGKIFIKMRWCFKIRNKKIGYEMVKIRVKWLWKIKMIMKV